ncbi:BCCT family transporter [Inediibacterium massiliense]|uniref:BCCT family transporter n=1 Tax=Inediibacterium massiliense TaxID=1658111 RepID=UPI0006B67132|nr:BCCT family transporter [Inediibacterium massiliense]
MNKKVIKLKKELHERNFTRFGLDLNLNVTIMSALVLISFIIYSLFNIKEASKNLEQFKGFIISNFDNVFIIAANFFVIALVSIAFSKAGKIRLGGSDAKPEFTNFGWYSMLMSAGMGIGLMFWSVGEPIYHHIASPVFESSNRNYSALATTFFHWGLHPWAIYGIISLALAYFTFNKKLPLSPRSFFYPIIGERIFGFFGDVIDSLAVLAALAGLATSLGLGVQQINSGLTHLFKIEYSVTVQVILISSITLVATASVVSGIDKGVKFLSEMNMKVAFMMMLLILVIGPTAFILKSMVFSSGLYVKDLIQVSLFVNKMNTDWSHNWTVFYWAWWISWSPFVGMFIAKVSKGRTIREFIVAVLLIPTVLSIIWLSIFGSTALYTDAGVCGALSQVVSENLSIALFEMIDFMKSPILIDFVKVLVNGIGVFLIITFFVTSSDSGSLVVDSLASGGKINSPVPQRIFWALMEGVIAAVLLIVGGHKALSVLQAAVITTGLPFAVIISIVTIVLIQEFMIGKKDKKEVIEYSK